MKYLLITVLGNMEVGVIGTTFLETGKGIGGLHAVHTHFAEAQSIYFEVRMHITYSTRLHCFFNLLFMYFTSLNFVTLFCSAIWFCLCYACIN